MNFIKSSLLISTTLIWALECLQAAGEEIPSKEPEWKLVIRLRSAPQPDASVSPTCETNVDRPVPFIRSFFSRSDEERNLTSLMKTWTNTKPSELENNEIVKEGDIRQISSGHSGAELFKTRVGNKIYYLKVFEEDSRSDEFYRTQGAWISFRTAKNKSQDFRNLHLAELVGAVVPEKFVAKTNPCVLIFEEASGISVHERLTNFIKIPQEVESFTPVMEAVAEQMANFHLLMRTKMLDNAKIVSHDAQAVGKYSKVINITDEKDKTPVTSDFRFYLDFYNKVYRQEASDHLISQIVTVTHGDAHSDNIFFDESGQVTFIDYGKMATTADGFDNPCQDIGRFLGSLWFTVAETMCEQPTQTDLVGKLKILEASFMTKYMEIFLKGASDKKALERLIIIGTELYKRDLYATKLKDNKALLSTLGRLQLLLNCGEDVLLRCCSRDSDIRKRLHGNSTKKGSLKIDNKLLGRTNFDHERGYHWNIEPLFIKGQTVFTIQRYSPNTKVGSFRYLGIDVKDGNVSLHETESEFTCWEISPFSYSKGTYYIRSFRKLASDPLQDCLGACGETQNNKVVLNRYTCPTVGKVGTLWEIIPRRIYDLLMEKPLSKGFIQKQDRYETCHLLKEPSLMSSAQIDPFLDQDVLLECVLGANSKYLYGNSRKEREPLASNPKLFHVDHCALRGFHWEIARSSSIKNTLSIRRIKINNTLGHLQYLGLGHQDEVKVLKSDAPHISWVFTPVKGVKDTFNIRSYRSDSQRTLYLSRKDYGEADSYLEMIEDPSDPRTHWKIVTRKDFDSNPLLL